MRTSPLFLLVPLLLPACSKGPDPVDRAATHAIATYSELAQSLATVHSEEDLKQLESKLRGQIESLAKDLATMRSVEDPNAALDKAVQHQSALLNGATAAIKEASRIETEFPGTTPILQSIFAPSPRPPTRSNPSQPPLE
ncbi:MAG: hypothetical protein R3F33_14170 [Planctomycetota bacterium]